jgi:hypothetical protein
MSLNFSEDDTAGIFFPHHDPLLIKASVANCILSRILVDNGSSTDIFYLHALKKLMQPQGGYKPGTLAPILYPLTGFIPGKEITPVGKIELAITFEDEGDYWTETIHFDVVEAESSFNSNIGRVTLNRFNSTIHQNFLCMKTPGPDEG